MKNLIINKKMLEKKDNSEESLIEMVPDECIELIPSNNKKEKLRLINVFERLKTQLQKDEGEKIADIYKVFVSEEKYNKRLRSKNKCLLCIINLILPLFAITNLIGIFWIIPINNLLFKLLFLSVRCKIGGNLFCDKEVKNEFIKQTHFFDCFLIESLKKPIDFKLIAFWSFIGLKFLKSCGFRKTSLVFLILNSIILFFILIFNYNFDNHETDDKNYKTTKIIILFLLWFFIGLTFGGSILLSQQTLIKYYSIIHSNTDNSENEEKKETEFNLIADNYIISDEGVLKKDNNDDKNQDNEKEIINNKDKNDEEELTKITDYENKKIDEIRIKKQQGQAKKEELIKDIKEIYNLERNIGIKLEKTNKKKINDKNLQNKANCFMIVSITTIFSCFYKYYQNVILKKFIDIHYNNYFNQTNINITADNFTEPDGISKTFYGEILKMYIFTIIISIILYSMFKCCAFTKKEEAKSDKYY